MRGYLLKSLSVKVWPVAKCPGHHQSVYIVKGIAKVPGFLQVVDLELDVWWLGKKLLFHGVLPLACSMAGFLRHYRALAVVDFPNQSIVPYYAGCTGDKSTPITCL